MLNDTSDTARRLTVLRIIAVALISGVVMFTVVALLVGPVGTVANATLNTLRLICGGLVVLGLAASFGVRSAMTTQGARKAAASNPELLQGFASSTLVSLALAEAPAIFGAVIVLLGGHAIDALLILVPLTLMMWAFPTVDRWEAFQRSVEDQRGSA
jgi:F0F1-type ATP synthase membrane subunit c/vacuolar-type H+-ATPase subunit K